MTESEHMMEAFKRVKWQVEDREGFLEWMRNIMNHIICRENSSGGDSAEKMINTFLSC